LQEEEQAEERKRRMSGEIAAAHFEF